MSFSSGIPWSKTCYLLVCYYHEKHEFRIQINFPVIPITHLICNLTPDLADSFKCIKTSHWEVTGYVTKCVTVEHRVKLIINWCAATSYVTYTMMNPCTLILITIYLCKLDHWSVDIPITKWTNWDRSGQYKRIRLEKGSKLVCINGYQSPNYRCFMLLHHAHELSLSTTFHSSPQFYPIDEYIITVVDVRCIIVPKLGCGSWWAKTTLIRGKWHSLPTSSQLSPSHVRYGFKP